VRIGLFGGTFDPVHLGHLRAAENAREALLLDRVALVPSAVPPHRGRPSTAAADRLEMARLAAATHPAFEAWDLELRRPGPSYTVDTVRSVREARPGDDIVLIVGADTWPEMISWREPERLFSMVEVGVAERPGSPLGEIGPPFPSSRPVRRVDGPALPISATAIRARVAAGGSVRYLVPEAVLQYIEGRRLYT
jgi:nicotinate-nucleotide adenylyltransferase